MAKNSPKHGVVELTPLEKVEALYDELNKWYGEADKKELRIAAKLLIVALDKFAKHGGVGWRSLVTEYVDILQKDPEKFEKIMLSNRGELREKHPDDLLH